MKFMLWGARLHPLTMQQTLDLITARLQAGQFTQHVVVNVAKLVHMQHDAALRASVNACDLINIDGQGVVWGARALKFDVPERVAGIDLFLHLIALSAERGLPVFLLGATAEVVAQTAQRLQQQFPALQIAGSHHGYFWEDEASVVAQIQRSGARLLFVAITSPKKENFIQRWREQLGVHFVMGVGGSFDIVAGKTRRAPRWMQRAGLEWLYRVWQEPGRMWRRYFQTNLAFAGMLWRAKWRQWRGLPPF